MRNIVYSTNITIDGYCDHTLFMPDDEMMNYFTAIMRSTDLLLYGRVTYELMVPYWPDVAKERSGSEAENEFAQVLSDISKVVFSRSLTQAEGNTQIMSGNLEEEIRKLKKQPGGKISIGGLDLSSQLMALGLVDEFYFVVHPQIAGKGRRLMEQTGLPQKMNLQLVASRNFKSGAIGLHYRQ